MAENSTGNAPILARAYAVEYADHVTACLTLLAALLLLCYGVSRRADAQKLAPGVWVVGGNDRGSIRANREKFRQNAKEMLEEGYRKACSQTRTRLQSRGLLTGV